MCILIYYICSKCYCGYPRFTECCPSIHPPFLYCPRGTQFKFRIVQEEECHLYPNHTPIVHPWEGGDHIVTPAVPSGATHKDGATTRTASVGGGTGEHQASCQTSYGSLGRAAQTEYSNAHNRQESHAPITHKKPRRRVASAESGSKDKSKGQNNSIQGTTSHGRSQPSSLYGHNTDYGRLGIFYNSQYWAHMASQYQYSLCQTAVTSAYGDTSPNAPYKPAYLKLERASPHYDDCGISSHTHSDYSFDQMTNGSALSPDTRASQSSHINSNEGQGISLNEGGVTSARQKNLEQLRRSSRAAYYTGNRHDNSKHLPEIEDDDVATRTRSPHALDNQYRLRSQSESHDRRGGKSEASLARVPESHSPSDVEGTSTAVVQTPRRSWASLLKPTLPVSSTSTCDRNKDPVADTATEDQRIRKESPGTLSRGPGNEAQPAGTQLTLTDCEKLDQIHPGGSESNAGSEDRCDTPRFSRVSPNSPMNPSNNTPPPAQKPKQGATTQTKKLWSAVASGKHIPSKAPNPSSTPPAPTTVPTSTKEPLPDQSVRLTETSTPLAATPKAARPLFSEVLSAPARDTASPKPPADVPRKEPRPPNAKRRERAVIPIPVLPRARARAPQGADNASVASDSSTAATDDAAAAASTRSDPDGTASAPPKPRLWSQLFTRVPDSGLQVSKTRSDGGAGKEEGEEEEEEKKSWPSLGAAGGRKRNTSS